MPFRILRLQNLKCIYCFVIICSLPLSIAFHSEASEEISICIAPDGQFLPRSVSDGEGGAVIIWEDFRTGADWDVYTQRVNASGDKLWNTDSVPICLEVNNQRYLRMVRSGDQTIVVWTDRRSGTNWDVYAQAIDRAGKTVWSEGGIPVCANPTDQSTLDILSHGKGGAIVVWEDERRDSATQDLYIQRLDPNGHPMWEVDGIPVFPSDSLQSNPKLIADEAGGFYVVWWDVIGYDQWHIMAHRFDTNGKPLWKTPIVVSPLEGMQGEPRTISDGDGGLIVVWQIYDNFINDSLYAQRIDQAGIKRWGENGVTICNAPGIQKHASLVNDNYGGFIAIWRDERDIYADLYGQRIDADGKLQWKENGIPICTAGGHQDRPFLVRGQGDRFFLAWLDFREDYGEESQNAIYGQQIDLDGKTLWEKDGVSICTVKGEQQPPFVVRTESGDLIVVWSDARRDLGDIYMRKF